MPRRIAILLAAAVTLCRPPDANASSFEGAIYATLTRAGTDPSHYVFTRKGNQLRTENTSNKLEPINIVDLDTNRLTIVYPHNTTFVRLDLNKKAAQTNGMPGAPPGMQLPPGFPGPGAQMPQGAPGPGSTVRSGLASPATSPGQIGPNLAALPSPPAGFPSAPPMPSMPKMQLPNNPGAPGMQMPNPAAAGPPLPPGVGPGAGAGMGMPMMPPMPMPGMFGPTELKKTDKTKKIQGFDCTLYTVSSRGENFEIWTTNDSALFPFQLITRDYIGRRFGPQMLEETWPELLHNKSLFTLEATLKMDPGGQERLSFKVDKIEKKKIDDPKLFQPPEKYIEIQAPQF